jgi:hypothetical protein
VPCEPPPPGAKQGPLQALCGRKPVGGGGTEASDGLAEERRPDRQTERPDWSSSRRSADELGGGVAPGTQKRRWCVFSWVGCVACTYPGYARWATPVAARWTPQITESCPQPPPPADPLIQ